MTDWLVLYARSGLVVKLLAHANRCADVKKGPKPLFGDDKKTLRRPDVWPTESCWPSGLSSRKRESR